jgi:hypothetical protein
MYWGVHEMKIKHTKTLKDGRRHVLIELGPTEAMPKPPLNEDAFYRLGYPCDDIVQGHHIKSPTRVYWDPFDQAWREA